MLTQYHSTSQLIPLSCFAVFDSDISDEREERRYEAGGFDSMFSVDRHRLLTDRHLSTVHKSLTFGVV